MWIENHETIKISILTLSARFAPLLLAAIFFSLFVNSLTMNTKACEANPDFGWFGFGH